MAHYDEDQSSWPILMSTDGFFVLSFHYTISGYSHFMFCRQSLAKKARRDSSGLIYIIHEDLTEGVASSVQA